MCGICGYIGEDTDSRVLARMNRTMTHLGPDEEGYYRSGRVNLAMRRLSIVDIETGRQPISNEDGSVRVVFNGEIYDHAKWRKDLEAKYAEKRKGVKAGEIWGQEGAREVRLVQEHAVYAGMIEAMDQAVVKVLDALDRFGLAENTVVFFMSDNGGLSTSEGHPTSNLPLRAGKGWLYEGGIREPMIVRAPGMTEGGSICSEPVISTDFYPTILDIAGLPAKPKQHMDGVSFMSLLKGGKSLGRKAIYWHYPHYGNQGGSPGGAVRAGDYKLIEFYEDGRIELYNLKKDIGEKNNLAEKMPDKAAEMLGMLKAWRKEVDAQMPTPNPAYKARGR